MRSAFSRFAKAASNAAGSVWAFMLAVLSIAAWFAGGFLFGFGTDYQIIINTGTTIVTFVMTFIILNAQNRDSKALHLKLDAVVLALENLSNRYAFLEDATDEELEQVRTMLRKGDA